MSRNNDKPRVSPKNNSLKQCLTPTTTNGIIIISIIIGASLVGLISGYFIGKGTNKTEEVFFDPVIDGIVNDIEHWELVRWHHVEYLIPESYDDQEYPKAYNHFFIDFNETAGFIYILADLVSDVTNDTTSEFFCILMDTNGDVDAFTSASDWNDYGINQGAEAFTYYPELDIFDVEIPLLSGWDTTLNATNIKVEFGYQTTIYGNISHRVYEIQIEISSLELFDSRDFGIGFYGYGTMVSYLYGQFWSAPSTIGAGTFYQTDILEYEFFNCGTGYQAYDINDIPTD